MTSETWHDDLSRQQHPALDVRLAGRRRQLSGAAGEVSLVKGKLVRMVGLTLEATGCQAAVGSRCHIETATGEVVEAEVVGFGDGRLFLMPVGSVQGLLSVQLC